MSTLVSDVIRKAGRRFGDTDQIVIFNADWYDWINEAQLEICKKTSYLTTTTTAAASTFPVTVPAGFIRMVDVTYDGNPLKLMERETLIEMQIDKDDADGGTPEFYYFFDKKINLYPEPDSSDSHSVAYTYVGVPTLVTGTGDNLSVLDAYSPDVVTWCVMRARERIKDYQGMQIASQQFLDGQGDRIDGMQVADDSYPTIRDVWADHG
jgi:hypothetical protein